MDAVVDARSPLLDPLTDAAPLPERVADAIVLAIAAGRLSVGSRVIETDLAAALGVSRMPLREAMSVLETQGILVHEARRGRRIAPFNRAQVDEIARARLALERLAVQEAAPRLRADRALAARLDACVAAIDAESARATPDTAEINRLDVAFHTELYAASGNRTLAMLWAGIARHVLIAFAVDQTFHRLSPPDNAAQHRHLRDLLIRGSRELLDREIEAHVMSYGRGVTHLATPPPHV